MTRTSTSFTDYNNRIEEGLRRAPEARAQALREFWTWMTGSTSERKG